jgi:hypothetical protein
MSNGQSLYEADSDVRLLDKMHAEMLVEFPGQPVALRRRNDPVHIEIKIVLNDELPFLHF